VHVPKAGGTTLSTLLGRHLRSVYVDSDDEARTLLRDLSPEQAGELELVGGHVPYGLDELIPRPVAYVTMLRDPVRRIVSHYWYVLDEPDHYLHEAVAGVGMTLRDYAEAGADLSPELENGQLRLFSARSRTMLRPDGACLEEAKAALREFAVVGTTERFDESLVAMQHALGLRRPAYVSENVGRTRPKPLDAETRELIESRNRLDLELYDYASRLLDERVRVGGAGFEADVRRLRRRNAVYKALRDRAPRAARLLFERNRDDAVLRARGAAVARRAARSARREPRRDPGVH
jgi:hypothetical protein